MRIEMRIVLALAVTMLLATSVLAEPIDLNLTKLDLNVNEGVIVSIKEEGVENAITTTLLSYPSDVGRFDLDVGAAVAINEPIVALAYHLGDLSQFGLETPFSKFIDLSVGVYAGFELNDYEQRLPGDEWHDSIDYGFYGKALSVKF